MGDLTLEDFRDETRFRLGGIESTSPAFPNSRLNNWVNWTYQWLAQPRIFRHPNLEFDLAIPLVAGQQNYSLVHSTYDGVYKVASVSISDDTSITVTTPNPSYDRSLYRRSLTRTLWRTISATQITTGQPSRWTRWKGLIWLDRVPNTTDAGKLLIADECYARPNKMTSDTSTTVFGAEWDEVMAVGSSWRGWLSMGEPAMAEDARENFGRMVNEIVSQQEADSDADDDETRMEGFDHSMHSYSVPG